MNIIFIFAIARCDYIRCATTRTRGESTATRLATYVYVATYATRVIYDFLYVYYKNARMETTDLREIEIATGGSFLNRSRNLLYCTCALKNASARTPSFRNFI